MSGDVLRRVLTRFQLSSVTRRYLGSYLLATTRIMIRKSGNGAGAAADKVVAEEEEETMLRKDIKEHPVQAKVNWNFFMLNCKLNSTNGGTFSNSV